MTSRKWLSLSWLLVVPAAAPLVAQPLARQFSVNFGAGGAIPREDLTSFMNTSPMLTVGFGYRPFKYFQADVGADTIFHAANVRGFQDTIIGRLKVRDDELMALRRTRRSPHRPTGRAFRRRRCSLSELRRVSRGPWRGRR